MRHTIGLDHYECEDECGRCKGDVDQEHRFPTEGVREHAAEQNADHEPSRACAAPNRQRAIPIMTFCEGGVDNRQGAGEDKGTAQALNRARGEQDFGPSSKATGKRGKGVQCEARDEYATSPEQVGCATAEQKEAARRHRVRADYGLQRVGGVAQVAPDLGKRHDDDVLVERDEEHRERKQCQDGRVLIPANVVFKNSVCPWGTIDTHVRRSSSPCAADESNSGRLAAPPINAINSRRPCSPLVRRQAFARASDSQIPPPISTAPDIRPSNFARAGFINHARLRPEATAHSASEKAASSAETKHMTASCGTTGRYGSMNCGRN